MRIGILTFHNSRNYGAVMQAYALVQTLEGMGYTAEVIDYSCPKIQKDLDSLIKGKNMVKNFFYLKKKDEFDSFNKRYLHLSSLGAKRIDNKLEEYDVLITGSDQVWNKSITGNDGVYFLRDVERCKISYAASCGDGVDLTEQDAQNIKTFDAVSVRENILRDKLTSFGVESVTVCDPTILAGKETFSRFARTRLCKDRYVFVFMIWKSEKLMENATRFADSKGMKVISNKDCVRFLFHSRPTDFVSWIANADCVFTNSFHGTVFSLLFHRPFISSVVKPNGKINTRVQELLTIVGCSNNILSDENQQIKTVDVPDYNFVDKKIKIMQSKGRKFLKDALVDR